MQTREDVVAYAPGQFWTGERTLNPADVFGEFARADGYWGGWLHVVDADTGGWKSRLKSNYPIVGAARG